MKTLCAVLILFAAGVACPADEPEELPAGPAIENSAAAPAARITYFGGSPQFAAFVVRNKVDGEWVERRYIVQPADLRSKRSGEIGRVEKVKDAATGKSAEVDFRSGCILLSIRKERFRFSRWVRYGLLAPVRARAWRDRMRITYLDRHGMLRRRWMDEGSEDRKVFPTGR